MKSSRRKEITDAQSIRHGVSGLYSKTSKWSWVFDTTKSRRFESVLATVSNALWYLDSLHQLLDDTFAVLCDPLNYETSHKRPPMLGDNVYTDVGRSDERICGQPAWVAVSFNVDCSPSVLFTAVHQLTNGIHKYYNFLLQQHESNRRYHDAVEPIRSVENYLIDISAISHVQSVCVEVNVELERSDPCEPRCFSSHPAIPSYRHDRWEVWKHGIWSLCYTGHLE